MSLASSKSVLIIVHWTQMVNVINVFNYFNLFKYFNLVFFYSKLVHSREAYLFSVMRRKFQLSQRFSCDENNYLISYFNLYIN